ncbi:TolB family protein [Oligoflexus tunisiensis]|uniref:TolB family protein n=1 Tax=Oligoflexus tunisiensis TaxID=708132 RepID=UPI00159F0D7C|nr:PD40 domain-containing protein [Oligoflexus tunisiensis]
MPLRAWILGLFFLSNQALAQTKSRPLQPAVQPVVRTEGGMNYLSLSPNKKLLAFTNDRGQSLRIMDLATQEVVEVTPHKTGPGFFWSPDGVRLFFRELIREGDGIASELCAFDTILNQKSVLDTLRGSTGYPLLNPYDNSVFMMHEKGILQKRLEFPGERPAQWQKAKRSVVGNWVVSQSAVLWLGELGLELKKMPDDGTGISSFSLSPDGRRMAWATKGGKVLTALDGADVTLIGEGRDPSWHPFRTLLVYAAARRVGANVYDYDLRLHNLSGAERTLTQTPDLKERWPIWLDATTLLYTGGNTTDLFRLDFPEDPSVAQTAKVNQKL